MNNYSNFIDITGKTFGDVLVIGRLENNKSGHARFLCRCSCGCEFVSSSYNLRMGRVQSCGCKNSNFSTYKGKRTRLYTIWLGMRERCCNKANAKFADYGGNGIKVCDAWMNDFSVFQEWAYSNGYRDYLTIDRIDNTKGYYPDNCRWANHTEQNRNRKTAPVPGTR